MGRRKGEGVIPGVWFLLAIAAMAVLNRLLPGPRLIPRPYSYAGLLLVLGGLGIGLWAVGLFRRSGTTVRPSKAPTALVVRGPYRFSRHPMYLGMTAALCGVAVLLGSASPWAVAAAYFALIARRTARADEQAMEEAFGEAYRQYKEKVRPWL